MKRIETNRSAIRAVLVAVLVTLPFVARGAVAPASATGAKLFLEVCAGCHSIGGGDQAGPDLIAAARLPRENLRTTVKRMEENAGPLKPEQIEALVDLLKDPDVKVRIAAASAPAIEMSPERKAASASTGRRLFFGEAPLANRGSPCFACHSVAGRGGNLAVDLTGVHARRGEAALLSTTEKPAFPLMKAAYAGRPVTSQEAYHLAAFFEESAAKIPAGATPPAERTGALHGAATGLAVVVLAAVALVSRSRRGGVRSRMVRKSAGGE